MFCRVKRRDIGESWWRHQMETFSALLALCAGNSPVPLNSPHKGQWRGAWMFSLIYAWINDWVNNREAGDLRRQRGHYDVIVMWDGKVKWSILRLSALYLRISALRLPTVVTRTPDAINREILTHCGLAEPCVVVRFNHHLLRYWIVACSAPNLLSEPVLTFWQFIILYHQTSIKF